MSTYVSMRSKQRSGLVNNTLIPLNGILQMVVGVLVILSLMERLYAPGMPSGTYNSYLYVLYSILGIAILFIHARTTRFDRHDVAMMAAVMLFLLHAYNFRALQYGVITFSVFVIGKVLIKDLRAVHRALVILGLVCSLAFCASGSRWSGFLTTSAPVFALTMLVSMAYLLFQVESTKCDILLAIVAVFLISMTQTRAVLLVAMVLLIGRFGKDKVDMAWSFLWRHKCLGIIVAAAVVALVVSNYELLLNLVERDGGDDSNRTRIMLMSDAISQWLASPSTLLFGNGGGYAMWYTEMMHPLVTGNVPVHQDVLMLLCDYGIVGVGVFGFAISKYLKSWPWYCVLIICMATFHNVFTTGACLLVLILSFQSLASSHKDKAKCYE